MSNLAGPGKKWFNGFFKRHSNRLSLRKGKIYECNRDADRDKSTLEAFYEEVKCVVEIFELTRGYLELR